MNFFGQRDEYVVSGSDNGCLYIWDKSTGELATYLEGDTDTVNVIEGHPFSTSLAVSGIDSDIKLFSPMNFADDTNGGQRFTTRMDRYYEFIQKAEKDRRAGLNETYVTRTMLRSLAARIGRGQLDRDRTLDTCLIS